MAGLTYNRQATNVAEKNMSHGTLETLFLIYEYYVNCGQTRNEGVIIAEAMGSNPAEAPKTFSGLIAIS